VFLTLWLWSKTKGLSVHAKVDGNQQNWKVPREVCIVEGLDDDFEL
jgi:hypothetical protein